MRLAAVGLFCVFLLASGTAAGQQATSGQVWGTGVIVKTIPATSFVPADAFTVANMGVSATGTVCNAAVGACRFSSGVELPTGALIVGFDLEACDNTNLGYAGIQVRSCPVGEPCGGIAAVNTYPGCVTSTTASHTVQNGSEYYPIFVTVNDESASVAFRAVRIRYQLQLSEPPASSSFDDVAVDDPNRAAIEAMVAAGVATGCGNENFCPDNPVTRAQLAVYLARALGLHWGD
jgi:hypothetical protein